MSRRKTTRRLMRLLFSPQSGLSAATRLLVATAGVGAAVAIGGTWAVNYGGLSPHQVEHGSTGTSGNRHHGAVHVTLPTRPLSYLGAYEPGVPQSYEPLSVLSANARTRLNLAVYYSGWGEPFQAAFAQAAYTRGAVVLVQIEPRDITLAAIAAGEQDTYLSAYADAVRSFGHAVILSFGHEMNGPWYPWGWTHASPRDFTAAWRHIVTLFRAAGAGNVTWLWTVNHLDAKVTSPAPWWPGSNYVTWVGINGYYFRPSDRFATVFGPTIAAVRKLTGKPVLLPETAVGPFAGQVRGIRDLFAGVRRNHLLGLAWFDKTQNRGIYHQDWRLEDSPAALAAFHRAAAGTIKTGAR